MKLHQSNGMRSISIGVLTIVFLLNMVIVSATNEENETHPYLNASNTVNPALFGVWNVTQITAENGTPLADVTGADIFVNFTETNRIFGKSGCNRFFGTYNVTSGNLSTGYEINVSSLGSTMMYCVNNMETEQIFLKTLESAKIYTIEEQKLSLSDDEGNSLLFIRSERREGENS